MGLFIEKIEEMIKYEQEVMKKENA